MSKKILIVENASGTMDLLRSVFDREGFCTFCAGMIKTAKTILPANPPDLIILDVRLPDGSGLDFCRFVRRRCESAKIPVIAFTELSDFRDKKKGFDSGVDQYFVKPIVIEELVLWVKALLRRTEWSSSPEKPTISGDLKIFPESRLIKFRGQVIKDQTCREFDLLYFLASASPRVLSRQEVICEVWRTAVVDNLVNTHIHNLRRKLPAPLTVRIQAVPG